MPELDGLTNLQYQWPTSINPDIFRTYDIRGLVDPELTPDVVYAIGLALGSEAWSQNIRDIIVARDGRLSGPLLKQALVTGLLEAGLNVIDIGQVPTPVMYFATNHLQARSGVIMTGSHNPKEYNGIKMVLNGQTLAAEAVQNLLQRILNKKITRPSQPGQLSRVEILDDYLNLILQRIHLARPLKIVVDCGHGVGGMTAPQLFRALGCEVIEMYCDVDGEFPHHHPDPTVPANLQDIIDKVQSVGADVGLAFDGDADRLGIVDNLGNIIWPDRQLMVFAQDILTRHPGTKIVFDVKCSRILPQVIRESGGEPLMWKTGHSLLKRKAAEVGALLAGEMSGHIFFKEHWFGFDDGVYAGARWLEILARQNKTCAEIMSVFPKTISTPELKWPVSDEKKYALMQLIAKSADFPDADIITLDGVRVEFKDGWGLVRCSNTTPCLTLRFEADNAEALQRIQNLFKATLQPLLPDEPLPF